MGFRWNSCARSRGSRASVVPARRLASPVWSTFAEIICALGVRTILGLGARAPSDSSILVALRGFADPLGLVVDSIADIYAIDTDQIESPPATWPAERAACFVGTVRVPEGLMGLLDLNRLVKI